MLLGRADLWEEIGDPEGHGVGAEERHTAGRKRSGQPAVRLRQLAEMGLSKPAPLAWNDRTE